MIHTVTTKEIVDKQSVQAVTCDKCHRQYPAENYIEIQEFHHIRFTGGYGSVFGDEADVECDICQHCLKKIIGDVCRVS